MYNEDMENTQKQEGNGTTYSVTAVDSQNRGKVQASPDQHSARKLARLWRTNPALRNVQIVSRDEYGRGKIEA